MSETFALILAGGGGTRLWPSSRRSRPKQLLTLGGPETLIAATFRRAAALCGADHVMVVTAADQADGVRAALPELGVDSLIVEPAPRNTAAAVGLGAALVARRAGEDALCAVLPSDAHVADEAGFLACARLALGCAHDAVVTVGIRPTRPETGFGYLRRGQALARGVYAVDAFVEKPDAARAAAYVADGNYDWNAGMFFFRAGRLLALAREHLPELGLALDQIRAAADPGEVARALYPTVPRISVDHGIMEKADGILVVPGDFGWDDVGTWAALAARRAPDAAGNVIVGDAVVDGGRGSVVVSEDGAPFVGVIGATDLIVVATRDAVLVVPKDRAQEVRRIIDALGAAGRNELL